MVILSIGAVLTAEAMNTAVEKICDRFMDAQDPLVRNIKDSAAAAVLIISITAALVGIMVFWPHARDLFTG
jgi:diacylglycerol kinase